LRVYPDEGTEYVIEYFATSDDSVRTILHEWNVAEKSSSQTGDASWVGAHLPQANTIKVFERKFAELDSTMTSVLGKPAIKDIKSSYLEETERDDVKWVGQNQLNVYLLMFKRDRNTYRQIRMIAYPT
jgi:hypothetical protein